MLKIFTAIAFFFFLLLPFNIYAQSSEGNCGRSTEVLYTFLDYSILSGSDKTRFEEKLLAEQFKKLSDLDGFILKEFSENPSLIITPTALKIEQELSGGQFLNRQQKYIVYGFVRFTTDDQYQLHLFLKSTCSDKTVAESDVFFPVNNTWSPASIAKEAVSKLTGGINIKEYELNERATKKYGLGGDLWGGKIIITVLNKALHKGEETEVLMEVQDCDGEYLSNKTISTEGTTGGIFTPSKFTTNSQGVGKAKFKMASDKEAILKASCETKNVQGCQDLYTGAEIINKVAHGYKITVAYHKTEMEDVNMNSNEDGVIFKAANQRRADVDYYFSLFYSPAGPPKDGEQVMIMPEFENNPEFQKKGKTVVLYNYGFSQHTAIDKPLELVASPVGAPPEKQKTMRQEFFSESPLPPQASFVFKNNELVFFSGGVEFPDKEEGEEYFHPVSSSFGIEINNKKYFPVKPKKVTDPNSPYKWFYEFEYKNEEGYAQQGKVLKQGTKVVETAVVQIWKSF